MPSETEQLLVGEWELTRFELQDNSGNWSAWGESLRGLLIYTSAGFVSVGINRNIGSPSFSVDKDCLFYSGKYRLNGSEIIHDILVASGAEKIDTELVRTASFSGELLELSGSSATGKKFRLVWKRL